MSDATFLQSVPADRLAAVLGCGVSERLVNQLAGSLRFRDRMVGLIASRLGEIATLNGEQAKILAMQAADLIDLSNRAGCVWHAGSVVRIVDRASRDLLVSLLGKENYELALACTGLQPPDMASDRAPEDIAKAVPIDGAACTAAWCEAQPSAVASRLRLMRPAASPNLVHETWGPQIITCLLAD